MKVEEAFLCWREGKVWLVGCRYVDIVAQGKTKQEAMQRFFVTFALDIVAHMNEDGSMRALPVPPPEVVAQWEEKAERLFIEKAN